MPGRAIEIFRSEFEAFGENQPFFALDVLELELQSGRLEQTAQDFKTWFEGYDFGKSLELQNRVLEFVFRKCVLEGNYTRAGVIWEQMNGRFAKLRAEDRVLAATLSKFRIPEQSVAGVQGVAAFFLLAELNQKAYSLINALQTESQFYHVRGLLFLIEGQVAEARRRFVVAAAPQGMTNIPIPWAKLDEQYVQMIDAAAKR